MRVLAFLDGTIADPETPLIRADDLGLLRGDGVVETILVVNREPRELGPPLDRLPLSARLLQSPLPGRGEWATAVRAVIDHWPWDDEPELSLKLVCTRGVEGSDVPTAFALGNPVGADTRRKRTEGVSAITLERGYAPDLMERAPWLLLSAKTLSYAINMAAMREAEARGADEAIFTATDGSVLEGPTSNVVLARGRTLIFTPPASAILRGTTQGALFRAAEKAGWETKLERFPVEDLFTSDGVWLASSVRLISHVHTIDGTAVKFDPQLHQEIVDLYESNY